MFLLEYTVIIVFDDGNDGNDVVTLLVSDFGSQCGEYCFKKNCWFV